MEAAGRRVRLFRRVDDDLENQPADLSEDEHAWWAAREKVAGGPRGPRHEAEAPPRPPDPLAARQRTAESMFGRQPPPPTPPADETTETTEATKTTVEGEEAEQTVEADLAVLGGIDLDSAHLVLQVDIGADWEAITRAHRRLAKQFHPDRLFAFSPDARELGRTRMSEINAAHATLRALHFR
jgi:hypothetical protein